MILKGLKTMIEASVRELELKITIKDFKEYLNSRGLETLTKWLEQVPEDVNSQVMDTLCFLLTSLHRYMKPEDKINYFLNLNTTLLLHSINTDDSLDYVNLCFTLDTVNVNLEDLIFIKGGKNEKK